MSVMTGVKLNPLQFYRSSAAPCPYLPGRIERKLFARLSGQETTDVNATLSQAGFRRSHDIIYKPACPGCMACVPVRVSANRFVLTPSLARIARRGRNFIISEQPAKPDMVQYDLFLSYEAHRHADSDMARMSYEDYVAMMTEGQVETTTLMLHDKDGALIGLMLADKLKDGWSAVYSFFATGPEYDHLSLGSLLILHLIDHARQSGLPYVYLGYWIEQSRKMAYKARFTPLERLSPQGWVDF